MGKQIIAVDLDDVLGNENTAMMLFINKRFGTAHTPDDYDITADYWGFWEAVWGVSDEEGAVRYAEFIKAHKAQEVALEPLPGAIETLTILKKKYELVIVTSRKADLLETTELWLERHFPATFAGVHFIELRGGRHKISKAQICQEIGAAYLIDDNAEHCTLAQEAGVQSLLFGNYGWNRAVKVPETVVRVADWRAVQEYFDAI